MAKDNRFITAQVPTELVSKVDEIIKLYNSDNFNKNKVSKSSLIRNAFIDFINSGIRK